MSQFLYEGLKCPRCGYKHNGTDSWKMISDEGEQVQFECPKCSNTFWIDKKDYF